MNFVFQTQKFNELSMTITSKYDETVQFFRNLLKYWNIKHFCSSQSFLLNIWVPIVSSASQQKKNSRNSLKQTKLFYDFPQDNVCSPVRLNLRGLRLELINFRLRLRHDFKLLLFFLPRWCCSRIEMKSPAFSRKAALYMKASSWSGKTVSRLKKFFAAEMLSFKNFPFPEWINLNLVRFSQTISMTMK